jgi:predicted secreted protein
MKKMTILSLSLLLLLLLSTVFMPSCVTSRDIHVEISCDDLGKNPTSMRNDFEIEIGDKIYAELCANHSTGFEWTYEMNGDPAVKEEDHHYDAPESNVPGAAGKETWTFEGVSKGTTEILMAYSQPWDGGIKKEWTYKISVVVK